MTYRCQVSVSLLICLVVIRAWPIWNDDTLSESSSEDVIYDSASLNELFSDIPIEFEGENSGEAGVVDELTSSLLNKRQLGRVVELQSVFHFVCNRLGQDVQTRQFKWNVTYNAFDRQVYYHPWTNVRSITPGVQTGWNPIDYAGVWHGQMCVPVSERTQCYYHFWQHFYGQAYPGYTTVIAPIDLRRAAPRRPGVEEYCVPMGTLPNERTLGMSCSIRRIVFTFPGYERGHGTIDT